LHEANHYNRYRAGWLKPDTDEDGVPDDVEDPNGNWILDPGEMTDPTRPNTLNIPTIDDDDELRAYKAEFFYRIGSHDDKDWSRHGKQW